MSRFSSLTYKRRIIMALLAIGGLVAVSFFYGLPHSFFQPLQKPQPAPVYDYYLILDEADEHHLMYVPVVVHIGDEVLSEDNKMYKVVRIEENRAYARFIGNADLEKYK